MSGTGSQSAVHLAQRPDEVRGTPHFIYQDAVRRVVVKYEAITGRD
jgi:hypothetical protein